jgi:trehalose-6-phosphate synthase
VNPYAVDQSADALDRALRMSGEEQAARMQAMRATVADSNTHWWAGQMLEDAARLRQAPGASLGRSAIGQRVPA